MDLHEIVLRAEKKVHGKIIARIGQTQFDKMMTQDPGFRLEVDKTVLQEANCLLPEFMFEGV